VKVFDATGSLKWENNILNSEKILTLKIPSQPWSSGLYMVQVQIGTEYKTVQVMLNK
jgi:hypothetical protein